MRTTLNKSVLLDDSMKLQVLPPVKHQLKNILFWGFQWGIAVYFYFFERELARLAAVQGESLEELEKEKTSFKSSLPFHSALEPWLVGKKFVSHVD